MDKRPRTVAPSVGGAAAFLVIVETSDVSSTFVSERARGIGGGVAEAGVIAVATGKVGADDNAVAKMELTMSLNLPLKKKPTSERGTV